VVVEDEGEVRSKIPVGEREEEDLDLEGIGRYKAEEEVAEWSAGD